MAFGNFFHLRAGENENKLCGDQLPWIPLEQKSLFAWHRDMRLREEFIDLVS